MHNIAKLYNIVLIAYWIDLQSITIGWHWTKSHQCTAGDLGGNVCSQYFYQLFVEYCIQLHWSPPDRQEQ